MPPLIPDALHLAWFGANLVVGATLIHIAGEIVHWRRYVDFKGLWPILVTFACALALCGFNKLLLLRLASHQPVDLVQAVASLVTAVPHLMSSWLAIRFRAQVVATIRVVHKAIAVLSVPPAPPADRAGRKGASAGDAGS